MQNEIVIIYSRYIQRNLKIVKEYLQLHFVAKEEYTKQRVLSLPKGQRLCHYKG